MLFRSLSEEIGFIRPQNKSLSDIYYNKNILNNADDGVQVQILSDLENYGPKLSLPIHTRIGKTPNIGIYGMIIGGLVFHMVFGQTIEEYPPNWIGENYLNLLKKIINNTLTENIIQELISLSIDPDLPDKPFVTNINNKIQVLDKDSEVINLYNRIMNNI